MTPGSHAPAWEQVQTLQRLDLIAMTLTAGAVRRYSHAGAWEREYEAAMVAAVEPSLRHQRVESVTG